ncbi:hypothetical protein [Nocardia sp. XZ_19_231]|nr:hypothetical protein [Nocardia sp. XZ_19_231]
MTAWTTEYYGLGEKQVRGALWRVALPVVADVGLGPHPRKLA